MRYFFHIVDKHGLFPDRTGCEHGDTNAAVRHAERIAAELAKAGEFFRSSFVLVAVCHPSNRCSAEPGTATAVTQRVLPESADFAPSLPTENT
jgi:hypothetical protein